MNLTDEEKETFFRMCESFTSRGIAAPTKLILDSILQQRNKTTEWKKLLEKELDL